MVEPKDIQKLDEILKKCKPNERIVGTLVLAAMLGVVFDSQDKAKRIKDKFAEVPDENLAEYILTCLASGVINKELIPFMCLHAHHFAELYAEAYTKAYAEAYAEITAYLKLPQSVNTNKLSRKLAARKDIQVMLNDTATLVDDKDFKLYVENFSGYIANTSAVKLLDAVIMNCITNKTLLARIRLKDYMELRGLSDEKTARKQILADMKALKKVTIEYKGIGKRRGDFIIAGLYGGWGGIYNGIIEFRITPELLASIPQQQYMYIPREYFATNDKYNPHTAYFIRRIAEHKRMNLGKPNENIISVKTLIDASPLFPKYEEVYYQFTQKILEPFERDMDAIYSFKWHYEGNEPENYNEFITSNVVITWGNYPDVTKLRAAKNKNHPHKAKCSNSN